MIKNECKHEWGKHTNLKLNLGVSTYLCKKCNAIMTAAEVFQLEALLDLQGFQKYIAIIALVFSFFALLVSLYK